MMDILSKVEDEVSQDVCLTVKPADTSRIPPSRLLPRRATRKSCSRRQTPFQALGQLGGILGARSAGSPRCLTQRKGQSLASR